MYFSIDINKHCGLPVIYLGSCVCQFVKEVKYLGVMIHSSMKTTIGSLDIHVNFICEQIYCIALMMSSVHCFSHIILICMVVSYGLTTSYNSVLR